MYHSLFDVFSIGIGPSSSHTVGPMRAANRYIQNLTDKNLLNKTARIQTTLYGSLALTGVGHGTPTAIVYGLMGLHADTMDLSQDYIGSVQNSGTINLNGMREIPFSMQSDIILQKDTFLPEHSNGMIFKAFDESATDRKVFFL